jgi:hypothetical protein
MVAVQYIVCKVAEFNTVDVGERTADQTTKRIYLPIAALDGKEEQCKKALEKLLPKGTPVGVRDPNYPYTHPIVADVLVGNDSVTKLLVEGGFAKLWNMPTD